MSGKSLLNSYEDLFRHPYDNNNESLFELQWVFAGPNVWGISNSMPEYLAYSPDIAFGGWGGDKGATWWLVSQYEGINSQPDGTLRGRTLDQRLHATFMLPGFYYPEITKVSDRQKLIYPFNGTDQNFLAVKKYVIGSPIDLAGIASQQRYPHNTYMMRLAEMYLVYAEAEIGNNGSTTDATAIEYTIAYVPVPDSPLMKLVDPTEADRLHSTKFCRSDSKSSPWKVCPGTIWFACITGHPIRLTRS
jgi:hypothetical protein